MAEISQNIKYVKLDDGVSFSLVRTNPKLTTNTKLMYNGNRLYMESYASDPLMNRTNYKNVKINSNSTYNKDIASFLKGTGLQAYSVYQNFSDITISDSYDNQFETFYWCGAEYIDSSFYSEEIGFVAPLYLREKMPNYFLIFRLDTPSNYNLNVDDKGDFLDSTFNFQTDILDKAVLIKTFDLREGTILGNYIHNYVNQENFKFDKSMYVNFSNAEVTYYGINKLNGILEERVENFEKELLNNDNPISKNDKWFTEGFERNNLIFPYIMNIEYLFDDENFTHKNGEVYDFARYIGVYCNNIEFGEFIDLNELESFGNTEDNVIYYFEDNRKKLHRYSNNKNGGFKIDGKSGEEFDKSLISGFEKERVTGYAEPLDIYEGFINRAQYGFEILKQLEHGDWFGLEYDGHVECYFADNNITDVSEKEESIEVYEYFRFNVSENSSLSDIAASLAKSINQNKRSKFEASYSDNVIVIYSKKEGKEYNGSSTGGAKILMEASLLYNGKISLPFSKNVKNICEYKQIINNNSDTVNPTSDVYDILKNMLGDYYIDYFCGACNADIDETSDIYKNVFKIYIDECLFFDIDRYLKTKNGNGRRICSNMMYVNVDGKIDSNYRLVIVDDVPEGKEGDVGYDVSVSSTYQVEIMDLFKPNHGVLSWFPVKDFDFDMNYSKYGQYTAFEDECNKLSKKITYKQLYNISDTYADSDFQSTYENIVSELNELAKSPFFDDYGNFLETEYDYYLEQIHPDLSTISKTTPYILKWGYYDEQKDSCENPYRLNVNKVFGISNLSANTYLRKCDENNYTHSMPYFMTFNNPDYYKEYQYIVSDETYKGYNENTTMDIDNTSITFSQCIKYWIDKFKDTNDDMFQYFFSGKKYGKRFDRKYSRLLGGDKFHNPYTLFRGVKFEVVRQYNGVDKKSSEYNDYKFSFIYIPVMLDTIVFDNNVYFIKNDTFKFIVGIVFVNTMLGIYNHNIFNGSIDYFNKGFLYAACKEIIRIENINRYKFDLNISSKDGENTDVIVIEDIDSDFWKKNYDLTKRNNIFYMWKCKDEDEDKSNEILVTNNEYVDGFKDNIDENIIGIFNKKKGVETIKKYETGYTKLNGNGDEINILYKDIYEEYDTIIYRNKTFKKYGDITCTIKPPNIDFKNNVFVDICDNEWSYYNDEFRYGYKIDVSEIYLKSESLRNVLVNIGSNESVICVKFYNIDGKDDDSDGDNNSIFNKKDGIFENGKNGVKIQTDIDSGIIKIITENSEDTILSVEGNNGEIIDNLRMDITIKDIFDTNLDSMGFKDYFSVFDQISIYNITEYINNDYNVKYYSTVEDNKYKIRVIEPDSIEIVDRYEIIPLKIISNNKNIIGGVEIKEKANVDKIGIKVINRYSGFYNPIFNDILYYGDFFYEKTVGRLRNKEKFELPYSNTNIDYNYSDIYGDFGIIKNMYYHKTNTTISDKILTFENPVYPAINEYALDYRDYNIFSSSWDEGYFISQDDLDNRSICGGIGSMKDTLCMFGSKYLNLPDYIFIDTFRNGKLWDDKMSKNIEDDMDVEITYKEINNRTVKYNLFIEKRLKRYLKEKLIGVFSKYINKNYSFGNKGTIEDDVEEYIEKNILKLYKVDKVYLYVKSDIMRINNKMIENEYLKYVDVSNEIKIKNGFPVISVDDSVILKNSNFIMGKINEFDRMITYNLKQGFKESFGFGVSFKRK